MHTQVLGTLTATAAVLVLGLAPTAAQAHPTGAVTLLPRLGHAPSRTMSMRQSASTTADQSALSAYRDYLVALNGETVNSAGRDAQLVDGVQSTCPNALSDLNSLSASQLKKSALTEFGDELDGDLDLAYMVATKPALSTFASGLTGLVWATAAQSQITTRLIRAERALVATGESDLCGDATTLDAAPQSEPTATAKFLSRYRRVTSNLHVAVTAFQSLLAKFETASERKLVTQINTLVAEFSSVSSATEQAGASTVLSELGIDTTSSS